MIYSEPLYNQISRFLNSIGMGFFLCVLYIAIKALFRVSGKGKITVMVSDGIFCLITAFVSFFYMIIENNGTVRFNLVIGQLIGGLLLYFTFGRLILRILYFVADLINGLLKGITYPVRLIIKTVFRLPSAFLKRLVRLFKRKGKPRVNKRDKNVGKKIKLL